MQNGKRIILGIDPGSRITGFGVVWNQGSKNGCITYGEIKTSGETLTEKLLEIYQGILTVINTYRPNEVALEQVFMSQNPNSALKLGQARGAALVAAATSALPVSEYSPRQIKQAIVGYGAADKNQMQQMISMLLQLKQKPKPDAADALAIALCHGHSQRFTQKIKQVNYG